MLAMAPKKLQTTQQLLTLLLTLPLILLLLLLTLRLTLLLTLKLLLNNLALHNAKKAALGRLFLCAEAAKNLL